MLERMWSKGNTPPLLVGVQTCTATLEISMAISQNIRKQSTSRPSSTMLGIYPNNAQSYHKDTFLTMFITAIFLIARTWKQPSCLSTEEWMKKMWHSYTIEYYTVGKVMTSCNLLTNGYI